MSQSIQQSTAVLRLLLKFPHSWRWILASHKIEGWLLDSEADELFRLAKNHTPDHQPRLVELGSWKGKSSLMLAGGLTGKRDSKLYCIDPFGCDESEEYQKKYYDPLLAQDRRFVEDLFKENMKSWKLEHIVIPMKGYSFDFAEKWTELIDLLFVDANHEYEAVARDFQIWSPLVKKGGIVAFHDANGSWPGPTRVVADVLMPPNYGSVHCVASLAWAVKQT